MSPRPGPIDGRLSGARWRVPAAAIWAWNLLAADRERWVLWVPVMFGAGIAVYFLLRFEPPPGAGLIALVLLGLALLTAKWLPEPVILLLVAGFCAAVGFTAAGWRAASVDAPSLTKRIGPVTVSGRVVGNQRHDGGRRYLLDRVRIGNLPGEATPTQVRIVVRQPVAEQAWPGDGIRVRAILSPPSGPAAPGAFDFQRQAYFRQLGAVGFSVKPPRVTERHGQSGAFEWGIGVSRLRETITRRIEGALSGTAGAVATGLMTGERGAIPKPVMQAMRDAGLAHLLAISGLHIGLVAGILFFASRLAMAAVEGLALRWPIKKWSAALALIGAFAYLNITGATIPTQRAFLMTGLVLVAVMLDRNAISMRLVAWAAGVVLLFAPESLTQASFQMSFAAVIALVAVYEQLRQEFSERRRGAGPGRRLLLYLAGIALTSLVAGLATAPFAVFHFNRMVSYGLLANMLAVPLTGLWIMPWAMLAFLLMPLGLEHLALAPMGWGIDALVAVATGVADLPGAVSLIPAMPVSGLVLIAAGGLWLCLWQTNWRLAGAPLLLIGLATPFLADRPDLLVTGDAKLVAVRSRDGGLLLSTGSAARFAADTWLRRSGLAEAGRFPSDRPSRDGRLRCDSLGCIYRVDGTAVAIARHQAALAEDCRHVDILVSLIPVRGRCPAARILIDRFDLWRDGAHALYHRGGKWRVDSVGQRRGHRPWTGKKSSSGG